jgi:hypothetical protein
MVNSRNFRPVAVLPWLHGSDLRGGGDGGIDGGFVAACLTTVGTMALAEAVFPVPCREVITPFFSGCQTRLKPLASGPHHRLRDHSYRHLEDIGQPLLFIWCGPAEDFWRHLDFGGGRPTPVQNKEGIAEPVHCQPGVPLPANPPFCLTGGCPKTA